MKRKSKEIKLPKNRIRNKRRNLKLSQFKTIKLKVDKVKATKLRKHKIKQVLAIKRKIKINRGRIERIKHPK